MARAVLKRHPDDAVVEAGTTIVVDGTMLANLPMMRRPQMLRMLSGRAHLVLTGIAVVTGGAQRHAVERTTVVMSDLSAEDIAWYVASGEPRDRAGAYAIQGLASRFVPRVEGSYSNVVGLPVAAVLLLIRQMGLSGILTRVP